MLGGGTKNLLRKFWTRASGRKGVDDSEKEVRPGGNQILLMEKENRKPIEEVYKVRRWGKGGKPGALAKECCGYRRENEFGGNLAGILSLKERKVDCVRGNDLGGEG